MPPPKISPMPTTKPEAVDISLAGTDSVVDGPTVRQISPKSKNTVKNRQINRRVVSAPVLISR
ncbi:hypothetical protein D3C78_1989470 [compost metagenome]